MGKGLLLVHIRKTTLLLTHFAWSVVQVGQKRAAQELYSACVLLEPVKRSIQETRE